MLSPWRNQLPLQEYTTNRVIVYFYSGRWVPIMFYTLAEAISLHQQALLHGWEILVFPAHIDPSDFRTHSCTCEDDGRVCNGHHSTPTITNFSAIDETILDEYVPLAPQESSIGHV